MQVPESFKPNAFLCQEFSEINFLQDHLIMPVKSI